MAFLIGGANTLATGDFVTNSLRISPSDDGFLERTTSGVADSNRKTWTFSWWAKLNATGLEQHLYGFRVNADNMSYLRLNSDGQMRWANEDYSGTTGSPNVLRVQTNRYFRDPSAWYHIVLRADTTQATETDRIRFYINGVEETSMSSTDYPSQNFDIEINEPDNFIIGAMRNTNGTTTGQVDGYLSEVHFVDGQSYAPTVFGEYNDNGVWIPKDCKNDITYGTRGFYMQFKETGTSANSSGIGADTSGNDNHFTPNNLVAADITTDTPQNNFCTLNSIATDTTGAQNHTFSEGNALVRSSSASWFNAFGTIGIPTSGKWYYEYKTTGSGTIDQNIGFVKGNFNRGGNGGIDQADCYSLYAGSDGNGYTYTDSSSGTNKGTDWCWTHDDIMMVAIDCSSRNIWYGKNGTWLGSGDPANDSNEAQTVSAEDLAYGLLPAFSGYHTASYHYVNFGNPAYANSSSQADDAGYGDFEYDVPTGFYALCTKNLAEFG